MSGWLDALRGDPRGWLLDPADPAVRHRALHWLESRDDADPSVRSAQMRAMGAPPIAPILAAQDPGGWWVKPGAGYGPKYRGTTWSLIFLDQFGADGADDRISRACGYVLDHAPTSNGGFGMSGSAALRPPAPSTVAHCLNGNLVRALVGFGWLDDPRVSRAVEWQARAATGEGASPYHPSATSGPGFGCGVNEGLPCAWGATKALLGFTRIPPDRRSGEVDRAIERGVDLLLSVDPAGAAYPAGWDGAVSPRWFGFGFPMTFASDVLEVLEVLVELGLEGDPRLAEAVEFVLRKQDATGRWPNEKGFRGATWSNVEAGRGPSKWVTLRACRVLRGVLGD